ncbi:5'-methylthioadenosine/adenosylhomocysteine nucleosidase [Lentisphaera marina]|uniref:5'-methylthioadenosine/adenosylhomocysteine nucleosidase n=1 Tax=Lentisphaera marina TaxID=1111041 RepID=UPI0023661ACE|nr:5'-methylthioadenosine/adenosylhomocysteine nucleosidase [Lentisphaera marina]MDD7984884.1 5'-methylthioadenosine/adenosylhomocysteine nucleosidase [Lentisphaera marina]
MSLEQVRIAIIGALPEELEKLRPQFTDLNDISNGPFQYQEGSYKNIKCLLSLSGIGKVQAAMLVQHIADTWQPDYFIFTGVAGALNESYDTGDVVIGTEFIQHDLELNALGFERGEIPYTNEKIFHSCQFLTQLAESFTTDEHKIFKGRILTGDQFITHEHVKPYFTEELAGDAVEMEGAALAFVASRHKIPFLVIRTISDRADGNAACDFNSLLPLVAENSCYMVKHILETMNSNLEIPKRYDDILDHVATCAKDHQRDSSEVQVLTVTKNHPADKIYALYKHGQRQFAENRVQEMIEKSQVLPDDIHWHLIGPLQSNKVRQAVKVVQTIHSVDNIALAQRIDRIAAEEGKVINIFIQLNLTGEIQKSGVSSLSLEKLIVTCSGLKNVKLVGLMTMGPLSASKKENLSVFQELKELADKYEKFFPSKAKLSMGMSGDYEEAIASGSNILRIGSAIMGTRYYET